MADGERNARTAGYRRVNAVYERLRHKGDGRPAAAAEANARFAEFLAAFADRRAGDTFTVRVPVEDVHGREFVWATVVQIDDVGIHGRLEANPILVKAARAGNPVTVPPTAVADWVYVRDGRRVGGFT